MSWIVLLFILAFPKQLPADYVQSKYHAHKYTPPRNLTGTWLPGKLNAMKCASLCNHQNGCQGFIKQNAEEGEEEGPCCLVMITINVSDLADDPERTFYEKLGYNQVSSVAAQTTTSSPQPTTSYRSLFPPADPLNPCGPSWYYSPGLATCYSLIQTATTWGGSWQGCGSIAYGVYLVEVQTYAENSALEILHSLAGGACNSYWTYGDGTYGLPFVWLESYERVDDGYSNWLPGKPTGEMDMAIVLHVNATGSFLWDDDNISNGHCYICELQP